MPTSPRLLHEPEILKAQLSDVMAPLNLSRVGVAVSGGSDSVALMYLLSEVSGAVGFELRIATVDHQLRPESRQEAERVAEQAQALGLSHDILSWDDPKCVGNLQGAAREARYHLLCDWARQNSLGAIAVGHTADDQAETVLMRLRRASGVSGLAAMTEVSQKQDVKIVRPMLSMRRAELRDYLRNRSVTWVDDPSNDNTGFERIRMRKALDDLELLGITVEQLGLVAQNMQQSEDALTHATRAAAKRLVSVSVGALSIEYTGFMAEPLDIRRRLLNAAIQWRSGAGYPPRRSAVMSSLQAIADGQRCVLAGCQIEQKGGLIWICRELRALCDKSYSDRALSAASVDWDVVWGVSCSAADASRANDRLRALGEGGLGHFPDWRDSGLPRAAMLALPSIWNDGVPVAVPLLQEVSGYCFLTKELQL